MTLQQSAAALTEGVSDRATDSQSAPVSPDSFTSRQPVPICGIVFFVYPNRLADAPVVMPASRISAFRRLLNGLVRLVTRPHAEPAGTLIHPSPDPVSDPEMAHALLRLHDCLSMARELVPPAEWNAKVEWIVGSKRYSEMRAADFDRETVDAVVVGLEELAARLNRTPLEPSKDPYAAALRDHLSRQSVVRGLRDATVGYVLASGFSITAADSPAPPDSRLPN